jgi:hypothetical protein
MRKLVAFLGLATFLFCQSCKEDPIIVETAKLEIKINAYYGDQPIEFGTQYEFQEQSSITFDQFAFYISDVSIIADQAGTETELFEIDFVDFNESASTFVRTSTNIPLGTYSKMKIGIGVNPELNLTIPSDYSNTHSLSQRDFYWDELNSYVFSKLTGELDTDGDQNLDRSFEIYSGTNELFQKVTIPIQLNLINNQTGNLTFGVDIKKLFEQLDGEMVNISDIPQSQDGLDLTFAAELMSRFPSAIFLE